MMARWVKVFPALKTKSTLLVLFIPSANRFGRSLGKKTQTKWVRRALKILGQHLEGATAFPRGMGVWRDAARHGKLVWDRPVIIQSYVDATALERNSDVVRDFLIKMGISTRQGAVAFVIDRDFFEISFPLENP